MSNIVKVVCISLDQKYKHHRKLEIGKIYDGVITESLIKIYADSDIFGYYHSYMFLTIAEWRAKRIDLILED
jgi:hypothetical protein